jgi:competence protein ComEC
MKNRGGKDGCRSNTLSTTTTTIRALKALQAFLNPFLEERERWFLWLPVFLGLGIGVYFTLPQEPALWPFLLALVLCGAAAFLLRMTFFLPVLLAGMMTMLGISAAVLETRLMAQPMLREMLDGVEVTGRVMVINRLPDGYRLWLEDVQVEGLPQAQTPRALRLKIKYQKEKPKPGDWISVKATLYPLSRAPEPGGFDFRRYAFYQGYGATGFALGKWLLAHGPPPQGLQGMALFFERVRVAITDHIYALGSTRESAISAALITGDQAGIDKNTLAAMRVSGISHILSVSGMHIALVAGIVFFTLRALMALAPWVALHWPIKKIAALAGLGAAIFYTAMCAAPVPAVRSVLMTGIVLLAIMLDRRALSMRLIAFAAMATLLLSPSAMLDPSFQLSFGTVMALIAAYEKKEVDLLRRFSRESILGKIRFYFLASIFTSVIATIATAPLILFYFQQVNWYGVLTNLIAVPISSFIIMPAAIIAVLAMPFGVQEWPLQAMQWGVALMVRSAEFVARLPGAVTYHPASPFYALLLVASGGLWLCLWRRHWRFMGFVPFILGSLAFLVTPRPDILLAADGVTMAVQLEDGSRIVRARDREDFIVQNWLQRDGRRPSQRDMHNWFDIAETGGFGWLACDTEGTCIYTKEGMKAVIMTGKSNPPCRAADLLILPSNRNCPSVTTLRPQDAAEKGAHAVYIQADHVDIRSAHGANRRPWE